MRSALARDRVLFPSFARVVVREPVLIIGHSRSGTTLIHELLAADEQFSWFMAYEIFPDARFVVMVRNPFKTIPSIQKMMLRNYKASGIDRDQIETALAIVGENSIAHYRYPFEILEQHPEARWTAIP
jgi:hypothetical protein